MSPKIMIVIQALILNQNLKKFQHENVADMEFQGSMLMPTNNLTNNTNEGNQNLPPNPDISHTADSVPENQAITVEPSFTVNHLLKKNMYLRFKRNNKEEWNTGLNSIQCIPMHEMFEVKQVLSL